MGPTFRLGCKPCPDHVRAAKIPAEKHPGIGARLSAGLVGHADLTAFDPSRRDQGPTESCTANATGGAIANLWNQAKSQNLPQPGWEPSEDQLFKVSRAIERGRGLAFGGTLLPLADTGVSLSTVSDAIRIYGVGPRGTLAKDGRNSDIDPSWVNNEPDTLALLRARLFLITGEYRIDPSANNAIDLCAAALETGHPIVTGFFCDSAFMALGPTGLAGAPDQNDPSGGGHAVYLVAYASTSNGRQFLLTNSWGPNWGGNGRTWVTEAWMRAAWDFYPLVIS